MGVKWLGCEASHIPSCSCEVKNEWSCICASPCALLGKHRDNLLSRLHCDLLSMYTCHICTFWNELSGSVAQDIHTVVFWVVRLSSLVGG